MKLLFFSFILFLPFVGAAECQNLSFSTEIIQCDESIEVESLRNGRVPLRVWKPRFIHSNTPIIVFLHGRGNSSNLENSEGKTMLEQVGLERFLLSNSYQQNPAIIIAPQDIFAQADGSKPGNDYWLGADGRDWISFLSQDLPEYMSSKYQLNFVNWHVAGISMGAHGAMKLAIECPDVYKSFVALSPIFRSTLEEIPEKDFDVFLANGLAELPSRSLGTLFLNSPQSANELQKIPHWVEIHSSDFGLDHEKFPSSYQVWETLMSVETPGSPIRILHTDLQSGGHSYEFWASRITPSLSWLINSEQRTEFL